MLTRWRAMGDLRIACELVGICLALTLMAWAAALMIGGTPLVLISARSNFVSYDVNRPVNSAISVPGVYFRDAGRLCPDLSGADGNWLSVLISPPQGARISYSWNPGWALVTVDLPQAEAQAKEPLVVERREYPPCQITQRRTSFVIRAETLAKMAPLPILGPGEIGREIASATMPDGASTSIVNERDQNEVFVRSATGTLWGGSLRVFGRTAVAWNTGQLYPVPDSEYLIPRGARLITAGREDTFTGTVIFPADGQEGFDVEVTANSESLVLFRPGPESQRETFATGIVARAFADPSSARLLLALAIFVFIFQVVVGAVTLSDIGRRRG